MLFFFCKSTCQEIKNAKPIETSVSSNSQIITARQRSRGKVMFSVGFFCLSICLLTRGPILPLLTCSNFKGLLVYYSFVTLGTNCLSSEEVLPSVHKIGILNFPVCIIHSCCFVLKKMTFR